MWVMADFSFLLGGPVLNRWKRYKNQKIFLLFPGASHLGVSLPTFFPSRIPSPPHLARKRTYIWCWKNTFNHEYFYEPKTKLYDCWTYGGDLLCLYGYISFYSHLFRTERNLLMGSKCASCAASIFYLREFFKLHGSSESYPPQSLSFCYERPFRIPDGS